MEINARTSLFSSLFEPGSVAFIGASREIHKWGFNILHAIVKSGYRGALYPINPAGGAWHGLEVRKSLDEVQGSVDLAVIVVPVERVMEEVDRCVGRGVGAAVIITAGFSETGDKGAALEREIVQRARAGGLRLVGPNTMGIYTAFPDPFQATMASSTFLPGPVGLISQSGNLATSITSRFNRRGLGLSRVVSSGNEADLTVEDYLELLENDEQTKLVCLYIEGLREPRRFIDAAARITRRKPVLLLKGGASESGASAAMSHTGAIAGDSAVFSAMCRQAGIIQVATMDEMIEAGGMLLTQPPPRGNRVGIITQGGGWGVIATDSCADWVLDIVPLNESVTARLDDILPPFWSRRNPIDLVAPGRVTVIADSIDILMNGADLDAVLVLGLGYMTLRARRWMYSPVLDPLETEEPARRMIAEELRLLDMLVERIREHGKPVIPVMDQAIFDERMDDNPAEYLDRRGVMAYSSPEPAVRALSRVWDYYRRRERSN